MGETPYVFYSYSYRKMDPSKLELDPPTSSGLMNKPRDGKLLWGSSNRPDALFEGDTHWLEWCRRSVCDRPISYAGYPYGCQFAVNMSSILKIQTAEDYYNLGYQFFTTEPRYPMHFLNWKNIARHFGGFYLSQEVACELHLPLRHRRDLEDFNAWDTEQIVIWSHVVVTITRVFQTNPYQEIQKS